jgi:hypothetical protein
MWIAPDKRIERKLASYEHEQESRAKQIPGLRNPG